MSAASDRMIDMMPDPDDQMVEDIMADMYELVHSIPFDKLALYINRPPDNIEIEEGYENLAYGYFRKYLKNRLKEGK